MGGDSKRPKRLSNPPRKKRPSSQIKLLRQEAERRLREAEKFKLILENMHDVVMLTQSNGTISYISSASTFVLGYSPEELEGRQPWIIHPEDLPKIRNLHNKALQGQSAKDVQYRIITKNEETKWISHSWSVVFTGDGSVESIVSVVKDITERKQLEAEKVNVEKMQALARFAAGIAHDFKNLLMGIDIGISLIKGTMKAPMDRTDGQLQTIQEATGRAINMTKKLMLFSRLFSRDAPKPDLKPLSVPKAIFDTVNFASRTHAISNVEVSYSLPTDLYIVDADPIQIEQVFQNLTINAAQAMPEGGKIEILAENIEKQGEKYIRITFADNGTGIKKCDLPHIFKPYFTTKKGEGTGIGLAASLEIVRTHNGTILVESEEGKGTTFILEFPASQKLPKQTEEGSPPLKSNFRILLMDNEKVIRDLAGRVFQRIECDYLTVANGTEATNAYARSLESGNPFDIAILDLSIPEGMGGEEAAHIMKSLNPQIKIVASSGSSDSPPIFDASLPKPYRMNELIQIINTLLS
ncbi:PAS domain S-box protein [Candidatus Micrarchaeota archaeon]|nr:PAS domain S-box protein [Candidatus Micrarchaeota archaeon]